MTKSQTQPPTKQEQPPEIVNFATVRGRPAVFLILLESLAPNHLSDLQSALGDQQFDDVDIVIQSGGGNIHTAYQIAELLRLHAKQVFACVPRYAKSAATLLCLGADEIVMDRLAQLGPLDTQVFDDAKGKAEFPSALNPFKALEQLQAFSLAALNASVKMLVERSGLSLNECVKHAIEFAVGTTSPLFSQLDPEKLGEYSRALAIGSEYGDRLLRRSGWEDPRQRLEVLNNLVHGYPSHDYIIDYRELQELGLNVKLFAPEEGDAAYKAMTCSLLEAGENGAFVRLVNPTEPTRKTRASDAKGE